MIETPLRSMINSGTWMPIMTPVHSTNKTSLNHNIDSYSFRYSDTYLIRDLIVDILHVMFNLVTDKNSSTRSRDLPSPWPSHTLGSFMDEISPSGPRVSLHYVDERIPLLTTRLNISLRLPKRHLYNHPVTDVTFDAIKATSEIEIKCDLTV